MKDLRGVAQYLLIPIERVSGIESPLLQRPNGPNYFQFAWANRELVPAALHQPLADDELSLAINPQTARSQNQLHIHIDCIHPDMRRALALDAPNFSEAWSTWEWRGHAYHVRRLAVEKLPHTDLFQRVATDIPHAAADMGRQTIFVTGAPNAKPGATASADTSKTSMSPASALHSRDLLVLVWSVKDVLADGSGAEKFQDHRCSIAGTRSSGQTPSAWPA